MIDPATFESADKITKLVFKEWGNKTLAELRMEASVEKTGLKYVGIPADKGQRFILIICLAKPKPIENFSRAFGFAESPGERKNWLDYTLADFSLDTLKGALLAYGEKGERIALAMCAIRPDIIAALEHALKLPR
jgi:hypothetical protein